MMLNLNNFEAHCWEAYGPHTSGQASAIWCPKLQLLAHQGASRHQGLNQPIIHHSHTHIYLHVKCVLMELAASRIIQGHKSAALSHMGAQLQELLNGTLQRNQSRWRFRGYCRETFLSGLLDGTCPAGR